MPLLLCEPRGGLGSAGHGLLASSRGVGSSVQEPDRWLLVRALCGGIASAALLAARCVGERAWARASTLSRLVHSLAALALLKGAVLRRQDTLH